MPLPRNKQELLQRLHQSHEKLDAEFKGLSVQDSRVTEIDGGVSACDVLAYQIGQPTATSFFSEGPSL